MIIPITDLKPGQEGRIVSINGGKTVCHRLSTFGLHIGSSVTKVSTTFSHGPVTVKSGGCQIALGHGQARRVMVEVLDQ